MDPQDDARQLEAIEDVAERARRTNEMLPRFQAATAEVTRLRREAIQALIDAGNSYAEVGQLIGVTRQRIAQIIGPPAAGRALFTAGAAVDELAVVVVQRRDPERGHPVIVSSTRRAVDDLRRLAARMDLEVTVEEIPFGGELDLNRDGLVVLVGPRVTPLVAQAITADPVIKWTRIEGEHWALTDTEGGETFRSDFDDAEWNGPGHCIAHLGRIRRPDGNGSFLYLGGAHAPGTAGAVEHLVRDAAQISDQARRSPWSAVVRTEVDAAGHITGTELATPVYTHGKR